MTLQVCYDSLIQWLYERCRIFRKEDEFNVAQLNIFWMTGAIVKEQQNKTAISKF